MRKYFCDICGKEVERGGITGIAERTFNFGELEMCPDCRKKEAVGKISFKFQEEFENTIIQKKKEMKEEYIKAMNESKNWEEIEAEEFPKSDSIEKI